MLAAARADLGLSGRPNKITRAYSSRNGAEFLRAPWCDMSITEWARRSGNQAAVLPQGDRAYTVWHAEDGKQLGRWHPGTSDNIRRHAKPGAVVFFDWGGTNALGAIDHVGLIEAVLPDGRVQTIEGNTADSCRRRVRASNVIAGFWNPAYSQEENDVTGDALYKAAWETDAMKVPYATEDNPKWKPSSVLVDHGVKLREILAKLAAQGTELAAQGATIRELVAVLAQRDEEIDVEALISRIEGAIAGITVRLDVADG
jgi:hypothetical protein